MCIKKAVLLILTVIISVSLTACGEKKILHCDGCDTEIKVNASSEMTEEWIIYCAKCEKELIGDDLVEEE